MQDQHVNGSYVVLDGESYYAIRHSQLMPEFFMSIVGADNHWMFISSRGALTAGRRNPDGAIFPYAADDQISAMRSGTGPLTLIRSASSDDNASDPWAPFASDEVVCKHVERTLYKSPMGNKVVFEERHAARKLTFRYRWTFSPKYGFVRDCWLLNDSDSHQEVSVLDGLQNILPCGVGSDFWMRYSNLGNAYKKNEQVADVNLGLFYLSSVPSDRAEPSEGLQATTVWHRGFQPDTVLLSTQQLESFRCGQDLQAEEAVRGKAGAFLVTGSLSMAPGERVHWRQVADTEKDHTDVINLRAWLRSEEQVNQHVDSDIQAGELMLKRLIGSSDGLQCGRNLHRVNRHFSNTLFNVMRGGVPLQNYLVEAKDFRKHVAIFNRDVATRNADLLNTLSDPTDHGALSELLHGQGDADLTRLGLEYLPLAFSRRHGDPTRPWNRFSIDLRGKDGSSNLNYQGNWRDIFQNWEALGVAFPDFFPAMICRFVNATTADGYNAYRITKDGLEWEEPEPNDPWSNIGYWCDHQIIYLLKLLEWNHHFHPASSRELLSEKVFVHAEVPYRIRGFDAIKEDPRNTIDFDWDLAREIEKRVEHLGSDGKLLRDQAGQLHHVTLVEKLLTLSLAKLSNFIPDGGIWLNTQRPEWNDANNALVGNGLSMVTTCYLHRWFGFLAQWLEEDNAAAYTVSAEVAVSLQRIHGIMDEYRQPMRNGFNGTARAAFVEAMSRAGSDYREALYADGPDGTSIEIGRESLRSFFDSARDLMRASIQSNKRADGLYHSYNLLDWSDERLDIDTLQVMLEGQVAVLSSGVLSSKEVVDLLDALRASALYREDQQSYLLYPDRNLTPFLEKNRLTKAQVEGNPLLSALLDAGDCNVIKSDDEGGFHFNGHFRNAADVRDAMAELDPRFRPLVDEAGPAVMRIFEDVFDHRKFTGRSGTFFAYEGLGSIYWHMVSKLGLAVSENVVRAIDAGDEPEVIDRLKSHLIAIREGIGAEKSPLAYGAFPSDPYSHTPEKSGVKQPGMTGQVKEDVLARYMELGVDIRDGLLAFRLDGFDPDECLAESTAFQYFDVAGQAQDVEVPQGGFAYTICQVPVIYQPGSEDQITVMWADGETTTQPGHQLDASVSRHVFDRSGEVIHITCHWRNLPA